MDQQEVGQPDNYTDFMSLFEDYSGSDDEIIDRTQIRDSSDMKDYNQVRTITGYFVNILILQQVNLIIVQTTNKYMLHG